MTLRIATFNAENLMHRFDFSGWKNAKYRDRTLHMLDVKDEKHFKALEEARVVAHSDDTLQLTALAVADCRADIICMQEVENLEALDAFEYGHLFKMAGQGYRHKYLIEGNDTRGIDVCVMMRDETASGESIEFVSMKSHAKLTYKDLGIHNKALAETGNELNERIFRRDCLEIDVKIGGRALTIYTVHFKSMGGGNKKEIDGRTWTMPVREAEAKAVRMIIEKRFGKGKTANKRWVICGDLNDYRSRVVVKGDRHAGFAFQHDTEQKSGFDPLIENGFSTNLIERRNLTDQWTLYHSRGESEQHLCQLDYILASPALADKNPKAIPEIIRNGQPYRTLFPEEQKVERYPRIGWDRPKASDHCPVVVELTV